MTPEELEGALRGAIQGVRAGIAEHKLAASNEAIAKFIVETLWPNEISINERSSREVEVLHLMESADAISA